MLESVKITPEDLRLISHLKTTYEAIGSQEQVEALTRISQVVAYHFGAQIATEAIMKLVDGAQVSFVYGGSDK